MIENDLIRVFEESPEFSKNLVNFNITSLALILNSNNPSSYEELSANIIVTQRMKDLLPITHRNNLGL